VLGLVVYARRWRRPGPSSLLSVTVLALVALLSLSIACSNNETSDRPVQAVASISVLADLVSQVGGDRVDVTSLLPPGADPHTFEPRPSDLRTISEADAGFLNGLGLEPSSLKVVESNLPDSSPLVKLAEDAVARGYLLLHENGSSNDELSGANPHLWLSVEAARLYVQAIRDALISADPEGEATYRDNADAFLAQLNDLETYVQEKAGAVPAANRKLVTTHDAFPYLAREVGFEVVAVVTTSPGQEPSAADIAELTGVIRSTGVPAVFREPQLGSEAGVLERAAEDTGVDVCILYSGALDDQVTSYLELMRHNADELARCLAGA
jgi:ABC-type Zn uptake system ZnuABC Zn-binding protein ZnuA